MNVQEAEQGERDEQDNRDIPDGVDRTEHGFARNDGIYGPSGM